MPSCPGADGWMFDGEDALGQVDSMSLDNQRNLRLAFARDAAFMAVAEQVGSEMNAWAQKFFGRRTIEDWRKPSSISRRGSSARADSTSTIATFAAPAVTRCLRPSSMRSFYIVHNHEVLWREGRSLRALPAEDPDGRRSGAVQ